MPNGSTHDAITIVTGVALAPAAAIFNPPDFGPANAGVLVASYLVSGLLFSPDLDLKSAPYKRWRALRWMWIPYQKMVPHRSWVSHSLLFGPVFRVAYFSGVLSVLTIVGLTLLNFLMPVDPTGTLFSIGKAAEAWVGTHPVVMLYAAAGFVLGGAAHTLADIIWSGIKRRVRKLL